MVVFWVLVLLCSITTVFYQDRRSGILGLWTPPTHRFWGTCQRNAATLLPIIQQHVVPGTIIHSDEWRTYSQVSTLPNVAAHATVNHSLEFVNLEGYTQRMLCRIGIEPKLSSNIADQLCNKVEACEAPIETSSESTRIKLGKVIDLLKN